MITTDKEARITRRALGDMREALEQTLQHPDSDPILQAAAIESLESEIRSLSAQLEQFENLRKGKVEKLMVPLDNLAEALILARVVAGFTQKALAERVGVKEQQIQRYETTRYEGASFARLKEVAWALGVEIEVHIPMPNEQPLPHDLVTDTSALSLVQSSAR